MSSPTKAELQAELDRLRLIVDQEMTWRDLELKMRDGTIEVLMENPAAPECSSVQVATKWLAAVMLHTLLGEDGTMPPNYRTTEVTLSPAGSVESITLSLEVIRPLGKSSHAIRQELEAELAELKARYEGVVR